jgi:uncharacterized protein (UPF0332 family)
MTETPSGPADLELEKAARALASARVCAEAGIYDAAVSRAYYAVFHAASALLASIGRSVRTHDGLRSAIGEHFIRPGTIPPRFGRLLARIAADRNDADYNAAATFTAEDAQETIAAAAELLETAAQRVRAPA